MTGASPIPGPSREGAGDRRVRQGTDAAASAARPGAASDPAVIDLPRAPGVMRRFWSAHPRLVDVLVAVGAALPAFVAVLAMAPGVDAPPLEIAGLAGSAIVASVALLWRRRWPLLPLLVATVVSLLPSPFNGGALLPLLAALYALGAYAFGRTVWIGFGVAALASLVSGITGSDPTGELTWVGIITAGVFTVLSSLVAVLIGISVRGRRRYVAALIARAEDLARERDQEAQLVSAAERARIAREMHDVVSHGITVMVTLAEGAAAQAKRDPERSAETMRRVADTGRGALTEMRRLLGVLAEPGDVSPRAPQPGADDLTALVERFRETGLPVRLSTSGPPLSDPGLALTVHRIVQESLTNVLRHAPAADRVEVAVAHEGGDVTVTVDDDAVVHASPLTIGAGRGLIGMRERALVHGGRVEAGPRPGGGWRVRAVLHPSEPHGEDEG